MAEPERPADGPILVGIDFSAFSQEALAWAVEAAIAFDTSLLALHVVHDPAESPGYYVRGGAGKLEDIEHIAETMMSQFIADERERLPRLDRVREVRTAVVVGLPVTRILEVAQREGARLIVMGAQGRTALADVLLGSKVDRVTRLSPIPVTVVKAQPGGPKTDAETNAEPA